MYSCGFCNKISKNTNSLRNHQRLCHNNPNRQESSLSKNRSLVSRKNCEYCDRELLGSNYQRHVDSCRLNPINQKECPVCKKMFAKAGATCSYSCANTFFRSGPNNPGWSNQTYRLICFHHHKKECIVCGEYKVLDVHHIDEDRNNNLPENLVPLCPTHHRYLHSEYKDEVMPKIKDYIEKFISVRC